MIKELSNQDLNALIYALAFATGDTGRFSYPSIDEMSDLKDRLEAELTLRHMGLKPVTLEEGDFERVRESLVQDIVNGTPAVAARASELHLFTLKLEMFFERVYQVREAHNDE